MITITIIIIIITLILIIIVVVVIIIVIVLQESATPESLRWATYEFLEGRQVVVEATAEDEVIYGGFISSHFVLLGNPEKFG